MSTWVGGGFAVLDGPKETGSCAGAAAGTPPDMVVGCGCEAAVLGCASTCPFRSPSSAAIPVGAGSCSCLRLSNSAAPWAHGSTSCTAAGAVAVGGASVSTIIGDNVTVGSVRTGWGPVSFCDAAAFVFIWIGHATTSERVRRGAWGFSHCLNVAPLDRVTVSRCRSACGIRVNSLSTSIDITLFLMSLAMEYSWTIRSSCFFTIWKMDQMSFCCWSTTPLIL